GRFARRSSCRDDRRHRYTCHRRVVDAAFPDAQAGRSPERGHTEVNMKNIVAVFALFLLAACAAPVVQLYEGPTLAPSQQAILRVEQRGRTFASERVDIEQVDDKNTLSTGEGILSSSRGAQAVYLLPGKHTARLRYRGPGSTATANLWFVGEAGG